VGLTYQLNKPQVACEELEGDLMLLHFGSGLYYNLRGAAADVCSYLFAGGTLAGAAEHLAAHFGLAAPQVAQEVQTFADQLVHEGLLVAAECPPSDQPMRVTAKSYEPPQFQKYDDMADQLLLDKIDDQSPGSPGPASLGI
jgi:hypothetical protein